MGTNTNGRWTGSAVAWALVLGAAVLSSGCGRPADETVTNVGDAHPRGFATPMDLIAAFNRTADASGVDHRLLAGLCYAERDLHHAYLEFDGLAPPVAPARMETSDGERAIALYPDADGATHELHLVRIGGLWLISGFTFEYDSHFQARFAAHSQPTQPMNLAFEEGTGERAVPVAWYEGNEGGAYVVAVDESIAYRGRASGRVECVRPERVRTSSCGMLQQAVAADAYRGRRVRFAGYLQSRDVDGRAGLCLRVDGVEGVIGEERTLARPIDGTHGWSRYTLVHDVPENAVWLVFGVQLRGTGTLWADDLTLEIIGGGAE